MMRDDVAVSVLCRLSNACVVLSLLPRYECVECHYCTFLFLLTEWMKAGGSEKGSCQGGPVDNLCTVFSENEKKKVCSSLSLFFEYRDNLSFRLRDFFFYLLCWVRVWRMAKGDGFQSRTCVHLGTTQRSLAIYRKYNHICRNELEAVRHAAGWSERGSVDGVVRTSLNRLPISTGCERSCTSTIGKVHTIFI